MSTIETKDIFGEFSPPSSKKIHKQKEMDLFSHISTKGTFESITLEEKGEKEDIEIPSSLSLAQLVRTLTQELSKKKNVDVQRIQTIMENYDSSLGEWKRFAFWNKKKLYTRNLIATDNENFTLMLLCWNADAFSPIHDHAGVECVLRCIQGEMQEKQYGYPGDDLTKELEYLRTFTVKAGSTSFINDSIAIHSVGNASSELGVTLHCYMPPYSKCRCFLDESSAESIEAHVTFDSESGELLNTCGKGSDITTCT